MMARLCGTLCLAIVAGCGGGSQLLGGRMPTASGTGGAQAIDAPTVADAVDDLTGRPGTDGARVETIPPTPTTCRDALFVPTAPGSGTVRCIATIADRAFRYALCSCSDLGWTAPLSSDSFDPKTGARGNQGWVGVNGYVGAMQPFHIAGSLSVAGQPPGMPGLSTIGQPSDVAGDLRVGGGVAGQNTLTVGGDLFSTGDVVESAMTVGGAIHLPAGAQVVGANATKGTVREAVTVDAPCDCATPVINIASVVAALKQSNVNAVVGLPPDALATLVGQQVVDLPCGHYAFSRLGGGGATLRLGGPAVVAVGGDVSLTGTLAVELGPDASLDLFVAGNVDLGGITAFGDVSAPARVRLYVAGRLVSLPAGQGVGASIYAPAATVTVASGAELSGALTGKQIVLLGGVTVHYDESNAAGRSCQ
ncbi:MAG TPA: hypothetical protein VNO55_04165 [Polyangia bacterium]|nr:hypothetical protein [Polyangia bacterium]